MQNERWLLSWNATLFIKLNRFESVKQKFLIIRSIENSWIFEILKIPDYLIYWILIIISIVKFSRQTRTVICNQCDFAATKLVWLKKHKRKEHKEVCHVNLWRNDLKCSCETPITTFIMKQFQFSNCQKWDIHFFVKCFAYDDNDCIEEN